MNNQSNMPRKGTRRVLGTALTVSVIAAVLLFNVLFSFVADHYMWQVDETITKYTKLNKVSQKDKSFYTPTKEFLDVIEEYAIPMVEKVNAERAAKGEEPITVNIKFCMDRDRVYEYDKLRMIQYTALALQKEFPDAVKVSYIDIEKNPSAVQKYKANSNSHIYPHQVIFEFGGEFRVCSYDYFFLKSDENSTDHWAYNGEQDMASLILAITRAESPIAAFITNHGEAYAECTSFRALIERAGYDVINIDLSKDEIPADCRLLICYDPTMDFLGIGNDAYDPETDGESEIQKLDKFLDKAYSFMIFLDKDTPHLPVLEEYLEEWGIAVDRSISDKNAVTVRDPDRKLDKDGYIPIASYVTTGSGASITKDMQSVAYPAQVVFPNATAITSTYTKKTVEADQTTGTEKYSYYQYYKNGVSRYMYDVLLSNVSAVAEAGGKQVSIATAQNPYKFMTLSVESRSVRETDQLFTQKPSYVVAFSSTEFASNAVLDSASYGNADILTTTLRYTGREIMPANLQFKAFKIYTVDNEIVQMTQKESVATTIAMTLLPIAICSVAGVVVGIKRKYR